jgi:uncharacterized lipoprotein YehR (DUF1307 family)
MKQLQFFLLALSLCFSLSLFGQSESSNHRTLYIATIDEGDHNAVYDILQTAFDDFPGTDRDKIKYERESEQERLAIVLRQSRVRIFYRSKMTGTSSLQRKVETVKAKIDLVEALSLN